MKRPLITTISAFAFLATLLVILASSASAAGSALMNVSATIPSKNTCSFRTATANIPFGVLNPMTPVNKNVSVSYAFRCMGSAPIVVYAVTQDSGLYNTGPGGNRMRHATNPAAYLPYSLAITPDTGSFPKETPPVDHTITVTGTVLGSDYLLASAGNYSDTITITINP